MKKAMPTGFGPKNSTGLSTKMEGVVVHFDEPRGFGFIRSKDFSKDLGRVSSVPGILRLGSFSCASTSVGNDMGMARSDPHTVKVFTKSRRVVMS